MKITAEALKRLDACADQVALFEQHFPEGCIVTEEAALKAAAAGLDVAGFMRRQKRPLWEAYERQTRPLWEAYAQQARPLWKAYARQERLLREAPEAYAQQAQPLWEAHERQERPFREAYERQRALCACRVLLAAEEETP